MLAIYGIVVVWHFGKPGALNGEKRLSVFHVWARSTDRKCHALALFDSRRLAVYSTVERVQAHGIDMGQRIIDRKVTDVWLA